MPNTDFFYNLQNYNTASDHLASAQQTISKDIENHTGRTDGKQNADGYSKAESREKVSTHALQNDRFLREYGIHNDHTKRNIRSSYESRSFGFHRGREGVRNKDRIVHRRNGCSGRKYGTGERKTEEGENCHDNASPSDFENFKRESSSRISSNPVQESHDIYTTQIENYPVRDKLEVTAQQETRFGSINSDRRPSSGPQRSGRNENYRTDLVRYRDTDSSQPVETKDEVQSLGQEGRGFDNGDVLRNGRQTMEGSDETREGEVSLPVEPNAVAEPRQRDAVSSYYDFLINEGSYKFWAVFQVVTACLLIYSAFAAIYYAKYTFSMMDYPDYLDEGFFFKRSGEAYITTTTAKPSSYSFLGLSPQTFQRIMNALSSKKYS